MKKSNVIIFSILLVISTILYSNYGTGQYLQKDEKRLGVSVSSQEVNKNAVTITINKDSGEQSKFTVPHKESLSVLEVLEQASEKGSFNIDTIEYDSGVFVDGIDQLSSSTTHAWMYYINGKTGSLSADQQLLSPQDTVEWKYEEIKF